MSSPASRRSWAAAGKVAAIQAALAAFCWGVLGYLTTRHSWLLDVPQEHVLSVFFRRELPLLGFLLVVALPALRMRSLARPAGAESDPPALLPLLDYPRFVGTVDLAGSVVLFLHAALDVRLAEALPIESAKIAFFGLLSGVLFGVLSYGLLQRAVHPLLLAAIGRGAEPPREAPFPLTRKIVAGFLSMAFVVAGLVGQLALFRAERHAERSAGEQASEAVSDLFDAAADEGPQSAAEWKRFLSAHAGLRRGGTAFVLIGPGIAAIAPEPPPAFDLDFIRAGRWRAWDASPAKGAVPVRFLETRMVVLSRPRGDARLGVILPPDAAAMKSFRAGATPVAIEILVISLVLAAAAGRGVTRPLRDLNAQTRAFGRNPDAPSPEIAPTDDDIGVLVHSTQVMRKEIRAMQAKLRVTERRAATVELLAGVAHEVRNPLFGITSAAAALERLLAGDARVAPHLELISRQSRRLARIMEEMLVLQRVPRQAAGALPLRPVLESAASAVRARLPQRDARIEISPSTEISLADADRDRIESVFANLFENSVLSSDAPVRIHCRGRRDDGDGTFAVIEVEDDGPGVNPEIHGQVFEPFVSSRPGGTGIGLALCRQIVAEHGGTIRMTSRPGSTVFSVRLPAV